MLNINKWYLKNLIVIVIVVAINGYFIVAMVFIKFFIEKIFLLRFYAVFDAVF